MEKGYFHRINEQTNNRFWINNPTPREVEQAIEGGARGIHHFTEMIGSINILDDSVIGDVIHKGKLDSSIIRRLIDLYQ